MIIDYEGVPFEIEGNYIPLDRGYWSSWEKSTPDEGGYFDDYTITLEGHDVTELLLQKIVDALLEKAEELMNE